MSAGTMLMWAATLGSAGAGRAAPEAVPLSGYPEQSIPRMAWLSGYPGQSIPRMAWLSGYWLSCGGGREVSETWSDARGEIMLGFAITRHADGRVSFEQMRIGPESDGGGIAFHAQPEGQEPASFRLVRHGPGEAAFESPSHDFPQRVIYRREGEFLVGRIEGRIGGEEKAIEWPYEKRPLNARCPAQGEPEG